VAIWLPVPWPTWLPTMPPSAAPPAVPTTQFACCCDAVFAWHAERATRAVAAMTKEMRFIFLPFLGLTGVPVGLRSYTGRIVRQ
jgi:hypothetical protein